MIATHTSARKPWREALLWIGGTLAAGGISALLGGNFGIYGELLPPPLAPPRWVFFPVWTALYFLIGTAAFLVARTGDMDRGDALRLYLRQLAVCALWPLFFFRLNLRLFAFFWILLLIALTALTINAFCRHSRTAGWLLLPYLLWQFYAAYLNLGFALRNW